ncbi:hypothetical protein EV210_103304 [Anaerospora hongkongensis]|uniref:Uncharacterized protein n=1 Tax=Anaerospora hongkongensis TaxID=244830 RepID=A0A4R1Q2N8_9FIRM|nr:hypothetical protein [Anaerospora hongkongensis]TCL38820.1 hypothetical protein EV210_103304 [Anaerospora hongkongensis]
MIKTVYGPPPADEERIEATNLEIDISIREEKATAETMPGAKAQRRKKGVGLA